MGASPADTAGLASTRPRRSPQAHAESGRTGDASTTHEFRVDPDSEERLIEQLTS